MYFLRLLHGMCLALPLEPPSRGLFSEVPEDQAGRIVPVDKGWFLDSGMPARHQGRGLTVII